jgi:DMSO/TMAO reductase YedYZ molybdopterin-dependent catalytic subunit
MNIKKFKLLNLKLTATLLLLSSALLFLFAFPGCYKNKDSVQKSGSAATATSIVIAPPVVDSEPVIVDPPYSNPIVDGLHVTGAPIDVDIALYRLHVDGLVQKELSLSFDEIKAMPSVRFFAILNCPGFFNDSGYWTGVEIKYLMEKAGIKKDIAKILTFSDIINGYSMDMDLSKMEQEGFLVAYKYNDKEFSPENGFPLRIVAPGEAGSLWVKWLGEIKAQ